MHVVLLMASLVQGDPKNPRLVNNGPELQHLAADLKRRGILVPLLVRRSDDKCIIIDGHRRHAAAVLAGLEKVPCIVMDGEVTEAQVKEMRLVLELQKANWSPYERAVGMREWMTDHPGATAEALAAAIHLSAPAVSMYQSLWKCVEPVQELARLGRIGLKQWTSFSKLPPEQQLQKLNGHQGEEATVKTDKGKFAVPGKEATLTIAGKDLTLNRCIEIAQEWIKDAKKAAEQGLSVKTHERACREKAKAS
jgi:ParB/RepB/Spo0J family partition protein